MNPPEPLPDLVDANGRRRHVAVRAALLSFGVVFVLLGIAFWLIPVITGIPFYVLAVACFAAGSRRAASWINRADRRLPRRARLALRRMKRKRKPAAEDLPLA